MDRRPSRTGLATSTLISANDAAVLGLLMDGESSGYDLNKRIHRSVGFFWTPAKSHVYTTLARLLRDGLATVREVPQETRPDKQIYRISEEGRADVQEELSQLEAIERTIDRERNFYGWLTLTYGLERDRATIRWADSALAELRRR